MHLYKVGDMLALRSAPSHSNRPAGPCEVLACLPHDRGPLLYRVQSLNERNERVVAEADLSPSTEGRPMSADDEGIFSIAVASRR